MSKSAEGRQETVLVVEDDPTLRLGLTKTLRSEGFRVEIAKTDAARAPDMDKAVDIINRLKDRGFLTSNAGAYRNVVKIRPPLVFTQGHAEEFLTAFDATMAEVDN